MKYRTFYLLLPALALVCWFSATGYAKNGPRLIFPGDKASVEQQTIRVIGEAPKDTKSVTMRVKGGKLLTANPIEVSKGAFAARVKLKKGSNVIEVLDARGKISSAIKVYYKKHGERTPKGYKPFYLHSKGDLTANCEECHIFSRRRPSYKRINPIGTCATGGCHSDIASKKFIHGPVGSSTCAGCHNPHGSNKPAFVSREGKDLCYACHTADERRFSGKTLHEPVEEGDCLVCHDPHQSDVKFQLKADSVEKLCASCHGNEKSDHQYLHGPVGTGDCVACHNPHASNTKALLYKEGDALCFMCHKDRQEQFKRKHVHKPVSQDCSICHDPHGSESRYQLRNQLTLDANGQTAPCLTCHMKINPDLADSILKAKVGHPPVQEGKCTACHTPHSTNYEYQLKAPLKDICFTCHLEMGEKVAASRFKHGPVVTNDCASCHNVHGSNYPKLLRNYFPAEFYTPYETDKYRICFDCHNERVALDKWSKETQFRNGNRNLHYVHVNREKGRSCKACHEPHAGSQAKHIREEVPYGKGWSYPIKYTKTDTGGTCVVGCHKPQSYDREKPVKYW